ncbi:anti-sigma regulatory factor (Ser/Thr protein kinase) [Catenulispora sp. GP43]|uniref:anti-sigma factor RsbA family regulatory protein n=1 Tax=Catenulispora sp. GP43 TaxID=3156263 RepID=UPI00351376DA
MTTTVTDHQPTAEAGFRHDALLYAGPEQFVARAAAFVRDALEHEQPVLIAVIEPRRSLLHDELGPDAQHVEFLDMWTLGRNPARIIPAWQQWVERHQGSPRGFRGIGEPIWAERSPQALLECQIHEQLLNTAFDDGPPWWLLCPYDTEGLPEPVITRAHDTHPGILDGEAHRRSTRYPHHELSFGSMFAMPLPDPDPAQVRCQHSFGLEDLTVLRTEVDTDARALGLPPARATDLVLAVNELITNSIRHGGGHGTLRLWQEQDELVCEVRDRGLIDDPLIGRRRPRLDRPGGAGLWLTNQLCDLVQIRSTLETGTIVRIRVALT